MAAVHNHANGANGVNGAGSSFPPARYSNVPPALVVSVDEAAGPYDIEIPLEEGIQEDPTELCTLLENEQGAKNMWMTVAVAYAKHKKVDVAIEVLTRTAEVFQNGRSEDKLSIYLGLCWLNLLKAREAPRNRPGKFVVTTAHLQTANSCRWSRSGRRLQDERILHRRGKQDD
jgi:RNA polymerase-associated protein CTR9